MTRQGTMTQDLLNGAMDETQASLARTMELAKKLAAQGRREEAQAALERSRRQAAGLLSCMDGNGARNKVYREMVEQDLVSIEKAVGKLKKPTDRRRLTRTALVVGAIVILAGFAMLLV